MSNLVPFAALLLVAAAVTAGAESGQPASQTAKGMPAPTPVPETTSVPERDGASAAMQMPLHDRASYIIGFNLGRSLKNAEVQANTDLLLRGLDTATAGKEPMLTDAEMQTTMQAFQQEVTQRQEAKMKAEASKNKAEGDAFLAKNKQRKEVTTTASGLQYEVLEEGTGPSPKPSDSVTVDYTGRLLDGTKFDSSVDRGQPVTFALGQVIPGWTEGLQLMKAGAKYKFYIPPALGYGEQGGGPIPPGSLLVFDVELLSIGPAETAEPPGGE